MRYLKYLLLLSVLALPMVRSHAQVAIGVQIGPNYGLYNAPPVCAYGFYPDYPFGCAPYGYWGPEWFVDGVFIGAGPWYNFYYVHPGYWNGYFVSYYRVGRFHEFGRFHNDGFRRFNRGFGERRFVEHGFVDRDRGWRGDRGFRGGDRGFRRNEGVRGGNNFRGNPGVRGNDRGFHGGNSFRGNEGFRGGGNRAFSGGGAGHAGGGRGRSGGGRSHDGGGHGR